MKKGWERKNLGDVCEVIAGQSPEGKFYNAEGKGMPFYQGKKDFGDKFIEVPTTWTTQTTKIAKEGDILMSVRAPVGPVNFATDEICIGRGLAAIRSGDALNRDFLFYQLWYLQPDIAGREGAVFASINKAEIEALPLAFAPLPEQQRIVGLLDEAFAGLATAKANAEKNLQNARDLFESHLNAVFSQPGEGWVEKQVGEVCTLKSGTTWDKSLEHASGEVPYVKVSDMSYEGNETEVVASSRYVNRCDISVSAILPPGTTIFPKRGGAILTNKKRITAVPICADLNIMGAFPRSTGLLPKFVFFYFCNVDMRQLGSGSSIPQINNYDIAPLALAFPRNTSEQATVVRTLESLSDQADHLESVYQQKLDALDALKKSLLHQAFAGGL